MLDKFDTEARVLFLQRIMQQEEEIRMLLVHVSNVHMQEMIKLLANVSDPIEADVIVRGVLADSTQIYAKALDEIVQYSLLAGAASGVLKPHYIVAESMKMVGKRTEPVYTAGKHIASRAADYANAREIAGKKLSDRIWGSSEKVHNTIHLAINQAVSQGMHPIEAAKAVDKYVKTGARTAVTEHPELMARMGHMLPKDLSYEALRLARTEIMDVYGAANKQSIEKLPVPQLMKWETSNTGNTCQHCKDNSEDDVGYGPGVYPVDDLPTYPAHPNCMCRVNLHVDMDNYVDRVIDWVNNPESQPEIEAWYNNNY